MSSNFQPDATICQYWKQTLKILQGSSHSVCCCFKAASCLTNQWNHLNNRRSLLLQTHHFRLSLLDHLGKLPWCCWYRQYTWKKDLPLITFDFWASLVNSVVTVLAKDWLNANTFAANTAWPFYGIWLYWWIVLAACKLCFIDVDPEPLCLNIIFPDCGLLFQVLLRSLPTPDRLRKSIPRGSQPWIPLIRLLLTNEE